MKKALVVVDVQNDFCEGGALAVDGGNRVAERLRDSIALASSRVSMGYRDPYFDADGNFWRIYVTKDWHINPRSHFASYDAQDPDYFDSWPDHCVAGSKGAELHPDLFQINSMLTFYKGMNNAAYSGFEGVAITNSVKQFLTLEEAITQGGAEEVDIVGLATDYCVEATALDSVACGFKTNVLSRFCAAVHPEDINTTLGTFKECNVTWK